MSSSEEEWADDGPALRKRKLSDSGDASTPKNKSKKKKKAAKAKSTIKAEKSSSATLQSQNNQHPQQSHQQQQQQRQQHDKSQSNESDEDRPDEDEVANNGGEEVEDDDFEVAAAETHVHRDAADQEPTKANSGAGRNYTVSVAVSGSVLALAQSAELRAHLVGQIARALTLFCVDEVIVYREEIKAKGSSIDAQSAKAKHELQFVRLLQYLETPQYLRKAFFPMHADLKFAGLVSPLDAPHHMRIDDDFEYREGVVLDRPVRQGDGSLVNAGMRKDVRIDRHLQPGMRVTVQLSSVDQNAQYGTATGSRDSRNFHGKVVAPSAPRANAGIYWGYQVRLANTLASVFSEGPHEDGYDLTIGIDEQKGDNIDACVWPGKSASALAPFKHALIVFGGPDGLDAAVESEQIMGVDEARHLFDRYLNPCPNMGTRSIRCEESILASLSLLRPLLAKAASE